MYFYHFPFTEKEQQLKADFLSQTPWPTELAKPYFVAGDEALIRQIGPDMITGITASGSGLYAPQGRQLQYRYGNIPIRQWLQQFHFSGMQITNFDMESSALYGLGRLFGFACCTVNVIIANRVQKKYQHSYSDDMDRLIETVLSRL
jgi:uridine phosphorylase